MPPRLFQGSDWAEGISATDQAPENFRRRFGKAGQVWCVVGCIRNVLIENYTTSSLGLLLKDRETLTDQRISVFPRRYMRAILQPVFSA